MEPIVIRQVEKPERKRRFAFPNVTTALLAVIATCLIVMVLQGFAILPGTPSVLCDAVDLPFDHQPTCPGGIDA